ncbi:cis-prenyltransferase [Dispira simplex]|nr:cis-prenyltransferase [Dispira simplex]
MLKFALPALRYFFSETTQRLWQLFIQVLRRGPVPQHVAFIMDGNRRYARENNMPTGAGHAMGFHKLEEVLEWCMKLGVQAVTVYAFSIDNFNRPEDEVNTLMTMAKEKLVTFCEESEIVQKYGVRVRVIGNMEYVAPDVKEKIQYAEAMTKNNNSDEITTAMRNTVKDTREGKLDKDNLHWSDIESRLFTVGCPDLNMLIRTSGETRFSDFLLWQVNFTRHVQKKG